MVLISVRESTIDAISRRLQTFYESEESTRYSVQFIASQLELWLALHMDRYVDDLEDRLTTRSNADAFEFGRILETRREFKPDPRRDVFNGFREYDPERLAAMISHFAKNSDGELYKTKLNKLLFYADLSYFSKHKIGISGATYLKFRNGPVPRNVNDVLDQMERRQLISRRVIHGLGSNARVIEKGTGVTSALTPDEIRLLDWVLSEYGSLTSMEISDLSHVERAFSDTKENKPIAYEYGKFFQRLPPESIWNHEA